MNEEYGLTFFSQDYDTGLLHVVCHKDVSETSLIFALFEFFPAGVECDELSYDNIGHDPIHPIAGVDTFRLSQDSVLQYSRKKYQAADLLKIYYDLGEEDKLLWSNNEFCIAHNLQELQPWPCLDVTSPNFDDIAHPYIAQCWNDVRAHHLFAAGNGTIAGEILKWEKPSAWLEERLGWDLGLYPDLWGSAHLVLPNPLFSHLHIKCAPPKGSSDKWNLRLSFNIYHPDRHFNILIDILEKYITGISAHQPIWHTISNSNKQVDIPLMREPEQIALAISDPERGLLAYQPFTGFLKDISIRFGFQTRERLAFKVGKEQHSVERSSGEYSKINLGERNDNTELGKMIFREHLTRSQRKRAQKKGEMFISDKKHAVEKINRIIWGQENLIIIDSGFSLQELKDFILPTCSDNADITIITHHQNDDARIEALCEAFVSLGKHRNLRFSLLLQPLPPRLAGTFVITGNKNVWQCGCTLGELGTVATAVSPLEDGQPLIEMLDLLIPQCASPCRDQEKLK